MAFDKATDVLVLGGDTYVSVVALVSVLGEAKVLYTRMAQEIGTRDAFAIAEGCKTMCDDLRKNLLKL